MRLNPFVYLSETDILFYLLVVMCVTVPAILALTAGLVVATFATLEVGGSLLWYLLAFALFVFVCISFPILTYWMYKRSPEKIARQSEMKSFQETKFPELYQNIQRLYKEYRHSFDEPTLMYNLDPEVSAFTFGSRKHACIQMSTGLLLTDEPETFNSILLHEMGHIENKDVGKTSLAISAMSTMKVWLPAILVILLLAAIYYPIMILYYGTLAGRSLNYLLSHLQLERTFVLFGAIVSSFIIFGAIGFALRNQIVRLREFYADARVLDWTKSSTNLENTLQKHKTLHSKFESLRSLHPSSEERIQVLRNNSKLFIPNLWIALSAGLLYIIVTALWGLPLTALSAGSSNTPAINVYTILAGSLVFSIVMFAISSELHKFILKGILADRARVFPFAVLLNTVKVTIAFTLGNALATIIVSVMGIGGYYSQLTNWATETLTTIFPGNGILLFLLDLIYLCFLGSMLVRRSFSKKDARRNFVLVSLLAAILYVLTRIVFDNMISLLIIPAFVCAAYVIIKLIDRSLACPYCSNKLTVPSEPSPTCPRCKNQLYSWAVYSF